MQSGKNIFGLGFRPKHYEDLLATELKHVGLLEIMTENYLHHATVKKTFLDDLAGIWPLAFHGVGLSIGGSDPIKKDYLELLKKLADRLNPTHISDHMCWTSYRGHNAHDLLPMASTEETLTHVASRVISVQDVIKRRLYLENPSAYISFGCNVLEEAEFLAELCAKTGCGIILDVNNLYVSQRNLGVAPDAYFSKLPSDAIGYFHVAGHTNLGDILVDTHDRPVHKDVWLLYQKAAKKAPLAPTILEWDGDVPPFSIVLKELNRARIEHKKSSSILPTEAFIETTIPKKVKGKKSADTWEETQSRFFSLITDSASQEYRSKSESSLLNDSVPAPPDLGLKVYRDAYWVRLLKVLRETYPTLCRTLGIRHFSDLLIDYLKVYPPSEPDIKLAGQHLASFFLNSVQFAELLVPIEALSDIASVEWAKYDASDDFENTHKITVETLAKLPTEAWSGAIIEFVPGLRIVKSNWSINSIFDPTSNALDLKNLYPEKSAYLIRKDCNEVKTSQAHSNECSLLEYLREGIPFEEALHISLDGQLESEDITRGVTWLSTWCAEGLIARISSGSVSF